MRPLIEILDEWAINSEFDSWKDFYKVADYETMMFWLEQCVNEYAIEVAQNALDRAETEQSCTGLYRYLNPIKHTKIITARQTFFP